MSHIEILVRVSEIEGAMEALPDDVKEEVIKAVKKYKSELKAEIREAAHLLYRNCDVGTYQEQTTRFFIFCRQHLSPIHGMCSSSCPCCGQPDMCHCFSKWMHMEYKDESESKKACSETPSSWKRRAE